MFNKILFVIVITLAFLSAAHTSYGSIDHITFRLVLNAGEPEAEESDTIISNNEILNISKLYFLNDASIEEVMIFQSGVTPGKIMTGFRFNEQGKKQFSLVLKKFPDHRIAIFAGRTLIKVLPPLPPDFSSDMIVIPWPRKAKELQWIAREINKKPPNLLTLYMDETAKYNETAADEWANIYRNLISALEEKIRQTPKQELEGD